MFGGRCQFPLWDVLRIEVGYCRDIDPPSCTFITRVASSIFSKTSAFRAFEIALMKITPPMDMIASSVDNSVNSLVRGFANRYFFFLNVIHIEAE